MDGFSYRTEPNSNLLLAKYVVITLVFLIDKYLSCFLVTRIWFIWIFGLFKTFKMQVLSFWAINWDKSWKCPFLLVCCKMFTYLRHNTWTATSLKSVRCRRYILSFAIAFVCKQRFIYWVGHPNLEYLCIITNICMRANNSLKAYCA